MLRIISAQLPMVRISYRWSSLPVHSGSPEWLWLSRPSLWWALQRAALDAEAHSSLDLLTVRQGVAGSLK